VNYAALGVACGCQTETVVQLMQKIKDQVVEYCLHKRKSVCLFFPIGQLWFNPNMTAEFKSYNPQDAQSFDYLKNPVSVKSLKIQNDQGSQVSKGLRSDKTTVIDK
jgi:hypothetical protein